MSPGERRPNVLFVSPWESGPGASGVISACRNLARGLAGRGDVDFTVLSLGDASRIEDDEAGVRAHFVRRQQRFALATEGWLDYLTARAWLHGAEIRPDVVHGQGFAGEGRVAVRLAGHLGVPAVVTVHGMVDKHYSGSIRRLFARRVMKQTLRRASAVVFVSPYRLDELVMGPGIASRVIENPIADAFFSAEPRAKTDTILYAGSIGRRKGLAHLVAALPAVRSRVGAAHLRVAGPVQEPAYADDVRARVRSLALEDSVEFLGPLGEAELRAEYERAGVLVLPSEEENAPQVIAEAMAAAVPVVATAVGGVRWMVNDGVSGFVVDPGDVTGLAARVAEVLADDATWVDMSRSARAEAERFRATRVAGETVALYRYLLDRARSPR